MEKITLAQDAMATRFEFVLAGADRGRLRGAGEEAFEEIRRLEGQLSLYRAGSEIAQINAQASFGPVRVSPPTFRLLERARYFWEISNHSFDITVGPLVRCWGFMKGSGTRPTDDQIAAARESVGMQYVELDPVAFTVRFKRAGMMVDLGSIGKGYALDMAAEILRDAGVENALLHGGTSTIYGLGRDVEGPWKVAIEKPLLPSDDPTTPPEPIAVVQLENRAMSVSAVWGKFFVLEGKTYGHVIDPRTAWPAKEALLGAAVVESAADSDALSTAILLGSASEVEEIRTKFPGLEYLQARSGDSGIEYRSSGITLSNSGV